MGTYSTPSEILFYHHIRQHINIWHKVRKKKKKTLIEEEKLTALIALIIERHCPGLEPNELLYLKPKVNWTIAARTYG